MPYQESGYPRHKGWSEWPRGAKIAVMAAAAVVFIPVLLGICGGVTMWLWNWLMPTIFHLPTIGFWQAVGILLLSHMLFRRSSFGRMGRSRWKEKRFREKMRERMRERMREEAPEPKPE